MIHPAVGKIFDKKLHDGSVHRVKCISVLKTLDGQDTAICEWVDSAPANFGSRTEIKVDRNGLAVTQ